jgi:chromosome partitioning protein
MSARMIISCLSQKGGVGKSTLARLIATEFAKRDWRVKIADLNLKQMTSVHWANNRMANEFEPVVEAQSFDTVRRALEQQGYNLIVFDGRPDTEGGTLDAARVSHLIVIPSGTSADDLGPQIQLAKDLVSSGIAVERMIFVINKTMSEMNLENARKKIRREGFESLEVDLPFKASYEQAQNIGRSIAETSHPSLNQRAAILAKKISALATKNLTLTVA